MRTFDVSGIVLLRAIFLATFSFLFPPPSSPVSYLLLNQSLVTVGVARESFLLLLSLRVYGVFSCSKG